MTWNQTFLQETYLLLLDYKLYFYFDFAIRLFASFNVPSIKTLLSQRLLWECFTSFWFDGG